MSLTQQNHEHQSSCMEQESNDRTTTSIGSVRKCWATARERNRMRARYVIQQRVFNATISTEDNDENTSLKCDASRIESPPTTGTCKSMDRYDKIPHILHRIIRGDTSYFSLQFMEENYQILNEPFPSILLWESNDVRLLLDTVRLRSRLGCENVSRLEWYVSNIDTCTILDYAVWLKRYRIIRQLIIGGINPVQCRDNNVSDEQSKREKAIGIKIRQLFLSGVIPLSLSCYIVCRVVELQQSSWYEYHMTEEKSSHSLQQLECMICGGKTGLLRFSLSSTNGESNCISRHCFCEACLWNDILKNIDLRYDDVVQCPLCFDDSNYEFQSDLTHKAFENHGDSTGIRCQMYQLSLVKYMSLPIDSKGMKMIATKKKSIPESESICSTWSDAVKPFIGFTQTSRRDKFIHFVEKGSYHHVKACIDQGIDLNIQNEYGQTALFLAVWQNDTRMVRLLLHNGCNPCINANGNISVKSIASAHGYDDILDVLMSATGTENSDESKLLPFEKDQSSNMFQMSRAAFHTLISWTSDHPGAGSFTIDNFIESSFIDILFNLWSSLPMELVSKKKVGPCSERRYYCDAQGTIIKMIRSTITKFIRTENLPFTKVTCGPHMRFLNYSDSGSILAPHIDLSRTDPNTTQRSTHSFLLYLSNCKHGGETALLGDVTGEQRNQILATVTPKRGRLLVFPHRCPHEGLVVVDTPKRLIRGELWMT
jgi:hypothetical protein